MNCRDVREVADSFLCQALLTETNHEILRHLDTCPSCRTEIDGRRRLRGALRTAFDRDPELQPPAEFADRLRDQLRAGRRAQTSCVDIFRPMARTRRRVWCSRLARPSPCS